MAQAHLAPVPPRGELKPRERIDRDRVGLDCRDVAHRDVCAAFAEQRADSLAEAGEVFAGDRAADGEVDRVRRSVAHAEEDRSTLRNSSLRAGR